MRQDEVQGVGTTLADFVAGTVWADVAAQSHEAKRSILNFFATALGSSNDPAIAGALRTLAPFSGAATSAIIGRTERLDAMGAAFVNAISANLLDFDDTHLDTIIHPAAPVAAPVLALAEARGCSGQAVLTAFILGVEVECRIGNAVSPGHYARGWHITSTCGVFGAAAACAKLLGLSAGQIAQRDRSCGQPVGRNCRKSPERGQERQRRQRGAQRPVCGAARGGGLFCFAAGHRGAARLGACHG